MPDFHKAMTNDYGQAMRWEAPADHDRLADPVKDLAHVLGIGRIAEVLADTELIVFLEVVCTQLCSSASQ